MKTHRLVISDTRQRNQDGGDHKQTWVTPVVLITDTQIDMETRVTTLRIRGQIVPISCTQGHGIDTMHSMQEAVVYTMHSMQEGSGIYHKGRKQDMEHPSIAISLLHVEALLPRLAVPSRCKGSLSHASIPPIAVNARWRTLSDGKTRDDDIYTLMMISTSCRKEEGCEGMQKEGMQEERVQDGA